MIRKLSNDTSKFIQAQQYVLSTYLIAKELIENAIDAESSTIRISITDEIIVEDDGVGVDDIDLLGQEGCTSKASISEYVLGAKDAYSKFYYGFRGQALAAISEICDLEVSTRCNQEYATKKNFTTGKKTKCARKRGTTVAVRNLFKNCPIRRNINEKNVKKDLSKIKELIEAYSAASKIHFTLVYRSKIIISVSGCSSFEEYFDKKFSKIVEKYCYVNNNLITFFMLPISIRENHCMIILDKRPVFDRKILQTIKSAYNLYREGTPAFLLQFKDRGDINISVDKTELFLPDEKEILNLLKSEIDRFFSAEKYAVYDQSNALKRSGMGIAIENSKKAKLETQIDNGGLKEGVEGYRNPNFSLPSQGLSSDFEKENVNESLISGETGLSDFVEVSSQVADSTIIDNSAMPLSSTLDESLRNQHNDSEIGLLNKYNFTVEQSPQSLEKDHRSPNTSFRPFTPSENVFQKRATKPSMVSRLLQKDVIRTSIQSQDSSISDGHGQSDPKDGIKPNLVTDSGIQSGQASIELPDTGVGEYATSEMEDVKAEDMAVSNKENNGEDEEYYKDAYSYFEHDEIVQPKIGIAKADFGKMEVIGQFNKGFIITKLLKNEKEYILAIDQHAANEIKNFEKIKRFFYLKKQKVLIPVKLDLNPIDEMVIAEQADVFNRNGFVVRNGCLETVPIYKNEVFSVKEFYELLENLKNDVDEMPRIRDIIASKACRSSVMIGDDLTVGDMKQIVLDLCLLDRPWRCPHGRPTFMVLNEGLD